MMLSKGMLWSAFVTHSLVTASPADIYFARHDGPQAYRGTNPSGLDNMTSGMQRKCKNMCFVAEDLKVGFRRLQSSKGFRSEVEEMKDCRRNCSASEKRWASSQRT